MTDRQQTFDGIVASESAPAAASTDPRLAHLSPTVLHIRIARYRDAVFAFNQTSPERAKMRKRWHQILDLVADNPLQGTDAFLPSSTAGRRLAELADPTYSPPDAVSGLCPGAPLVTPDTSDVTVSIPTGNMT